MARQYREHFIGETAASDAVAGTVHMDRRPVGVSGLGKNLRHTGEHVQVETTDQPQTLKRRQKVSWRDDASVRLMPADQCLQRLHLTGLDIDDRLKIRQQLVAALERIAQRALAQPLFGQPRDRHS